MISDGFINVTIPVFLKKQAARDGKANVLKAFPPSTSPMEKERNSSDLSFTRCALYMQLDRFLSIFGLENQHTKLMDRDVEDQTTRCIIHSRDEIIAFLNGHDNV